MPVFREASEMLGYDVSAPFRSSAMIALRLPGVPSGFTYSGWPTYLQRYPNAQLPCFIAFDIEFPVFDPKKSCASFAEENSRRSLPFLSHWMTFIATLDMAFIRQRPPGDT